jgi:signal transduction histidine kinase
MTEGTSTRGEGLSVHWTEPGCRRARGGWRRRAAEADWRIDWARVADGPAPLQLLILSAIGGLLLGLSINAGWRAAADGGSGRAVLYLAALTAACIVAAVVALRPAGRAVAPAPRQEPSPQEAPTRLLAQMHHELRTPLNAMIGFSEVMLRELHGPLGNARYQEYVAHISESGGRLLKVSEDALAIAATMTALVADRHAVRRERLPTGALLREAWGAAGGAAGAVTGTSSRGIRLEVDDGDAEVDCDHRATAEALQHLLGEAIARAPCGGAIAARTGQRRIEIAVEPPASTRDRRGGLGDAPTQPAWPPQAGDGLRLILARSLIEMQGATLSLSATGGQSQGWTARIAFPGAESGRKPPGRLRANAGARAQARLPAHRGDFAAGAAVAARASAGSLAAPPA